MAGKKGRSGRKSNADIALARSIAARVIPEARWEKLFERLAVLALTGPQRMAVETSKFLALYSFGVPTLQNAPDESQKEINAIRIIDPGETDPAHKFD